MSPTSSNPAFSDKTFDVRAAYGSGMSISGTVNKAGILMLCVFATAAYTWNQFFTTGDGTSIGSYTLISAFGAFIAALATFFKKARTPFPPPFYSSLAGRFLT